MTKKNYSLLIVFLVLLMSAIAYQLLAPRLAMRRNLIVANPFAGLDLAGVDRIDAESHKLKLSYLFQSGGWKVDNSRYNMEKGRAEAFLEWLKNSATSSAEIASNSTQATSSFGLDESALHFVLWRQGKKIADFKIGSPVTDSGFYLSKSDKNEVYQLAFPLELAGVDWRSRRISGFAADKVTELTLSKDKATYRYVRADNGFVPQGKALEGFNALRAIAQFADLEASGWPKAGQCALDGSRLNVIVLGKAQALESGKYSDKARADTACVRLAGSNPWYLISNEQAKLMFGPGK